VVGEGPTRSRHFPRGRPAACKGIYVDEDAGGIWSGRSSREINAPVRAAKEEDRLRDPHTRRHVVHPY
jgi:hypothetical protein